MPAFRFWSASAVCAVALAGLSPSSVFAKPVYFSLLQSAFPHAPLTQRCNVCHSGQGLRLNAFGQDFARLKREYGSERMTDVWRELRTLDSNGDGSSNEADINAGKNPGVPNPSN